MTALIALLLGLFAGVLSATVVWVGRLRLSEVRVRELEFVLESQRREEASAMGSIASDILDLASSVDGHAELLAGGWRGALSPPQADSVQRIQLAGRAATSLARAMQAVIDPDNPASACRSTAHPVEVGSVVDEAISTIRPLALSNCHKIGVILSESLGKSSADPEIIRLVCSTVLAFIVRHTPSGLPIDVFGQCSTIRLRDDAPEWRYCCLSMSAAGTTLDQAELRTLTDNTEQGRGFPLAGLGTLRLMQRLCRQIGGDLRIISHSGNPTYCIILPAADSFALSSGT